MFYTMSGGITFGGCASPIQVVKKYSHLYGIGSVVYIRKKAQYKGKLEPIVIKKVNKVSPIANTVQHLFNYVDTFNRVWMEDELSWQPEAVALAREYWENIQNLTLIELNRC